MSKHRRANPLLITALTLIALGALVPVMVVGGSPIRYQVAASGMGAVILQGLAIWVSLRFERERQNLLLERAKLMLRDRVRNQLQRIAIDGSTRMHTMAALNEIAHIIDTLSDAELASWEGLHQDALNQRAATKSVR